MTARTDHGTPAPTRISGVLDDPTVRSALVVLAQRRYTATLVRNGTTKADRKRLPAVERDLTDATANLIAEVARYIDRLIGLDDVIREADESGPAGAGQQGGPG